MAEHSCELTIIGDGEERDRLEKLIKEYQLADRVKLYGYSNNIHPLIAEHEALIVHLYVKAVLIHLLRPLLLERPVIGTNVGMMSEFIPQNFYVNLIIYWLYSSSSKLFKNI